MWRGVVLATSLTCAMAAEQAAVPQPAIPKAPPGYVIPPFPEQPVHFSTAEGQDIRVVPYVRDLEFPWSIAFLPDDIQLVSERVGRLRVIRNGVLDPEPVKGVPEVRKTSTSGLLDIALHPDFARNGFVYLSYNKPVGEKAAQLALLRGRWDGRALVETRDLIVTGRDTGGLSRIAFGSDGKLYMGVTGDEDAIQNPASLAGKILRLNDDGTVPADNPFVGRAGHRPEIFTIGHRTLLGLAKHPRTGSLWQVEMGPNGGDEVNVLEAGGNYGWPLVSLGRKYPGPWQSETFHRDGFIDPLIFWMPSISTTGIAFYTGDRLPLWKGNVFVGGMRYGEIPGTGRLDRIVFNDQDQEIRRESLLMDLRQRIRDVRQGPDGLLYLLVDSAKGGVLRIEPGN